MDFYTWLREVQAVDASACTADELGFWRRAHEDASARGRAWRAQRAPVRSARGNDRRYAVAIEDDAGLGLSFWIKRSAKGEIFLMYPRESDFDPHASYHLDGRYHNKSFGVAMMARERQPLGPHFRGTEHLGTFAGHGAGPRIDDPTAFDHIFVARPGVLDGRRGVVAVDLVEPGHQPAAHHRELLDVTAEEVYKDATPWIVVAIASFKTRDDGCERS